MTLTLSTVRCPQGVSPQSREVVRNAVSIGRGAECDWVLPDADRILSKRHCLLNRQGDVWQVTDTSSNGTLLDGMPLDPGVPRRLRSGDRLQLGAYEIEVRIEQAAPSFAPSSTPCVAAVAPSSHLSWDSERLAGDPFGLGDRNGEAGLPGVGLPLDFDPLGHGDRIADAPEVAPDHASGLEDHFEPPRPESELLPADWDRVTRTEAVPRGERIGQTTPVAPPPTPAADLPPALPTEERTLDAAPDPTSLPSPSTPGTQNTAPATPETGFAAFAAGARVTGAPRTGADEALRELGSAFRAAVVGIRRAMIARATIKGEFRIDQTMIRAAGNNPLKFAADDDDALAALLGTGRHGGMRPSRAVSEALRDMRRHELAVMSAMNHAVREMLSHLAPDRLLRELPPSAADALPGRRRQRAWEAYEKLHARLTDNLGGGPDQVFDRAFMRAYEAALEDLEGTDDDPSETTPSSRNTP